MSLAEIVNKSFLKEKWDCLRFRSGFMVEIVKNCVSLHKFVKEDSKVRRVFDTENHKQNFFNKQ